MKLTEIQERLNGDLQKEIDLFLDLKFEREYMHYELKAKIRVWKLIREKIVKMDISEMNTQQFKNAIQEFLHEARNTFGADNWSDEDHERAISTARKKIMLVLEEFGI